MDKSVDIHKAGAIILRDRHLLLVRAKKQAIFNTPGGKLRSKEIPIQTLIRELHEELAIIVAESHLSFFGTFYDCVVNQPHRTFRMDTFILEGFSGDFSQNGEIEELRWINTLNALDQSISPVFKREILPRMKQRGVID